VNEELEALKASLQEDGSGTSHIAALVSLAKTVDQVRTSLAPPCYPLLMLMIFLG
jgi:hypothetical protein